MFSSWSLWHKYDGWRSWKMLVTGCSTAPQLFCVCFCFLHSLGLGFLFFWFTDVIFIGYPSILSRLIQISKCGEVLSTQISAGDLRLLSLSIYILFKFWQCTSLFAVRIHCFDNICWNYGSWWSKEEKCWRQGSRFLLLTCNLTGKYAWSFGWCSAIVGWSIWKNNLFSFTC